MSQKSYKSRRKFIKIGASMILATSVPTVNAAVRFKRKSPASLDLLEVGLILGTGGHSDTIWGKYLNPPEGWCRRTGMIYTKVWAAKREVAEKFHDMYGSEIVSSFDSMVGKVDGVIVDDFNAVAYNYKLARPYLESGIPTFVNRPFADSIDKARDMVESAMKNDAPLMTASSFEHIKEVHTIRQKVKMDEITGYEAWNSSSEYYSHGLHGVWWAYAAVGGGIKAVSFKCENWTKSKGGATYVVYKDRGKVGPFIGKINEGRQPDVGRMNCSIIIQPSGENHIHHLVDAWGRQEFLWLPMLHRIQHMFETGDMPQTFEEIMEKSTLFTGAFYSLLEHDQKIIALDKIPEDWCIGTPYGAEYYKHYDEIEAYEKLFGKEKGKLKRE